MDALKLVFGPLCYEGFPELFQMGARALFVFAAAIVAVRFAHRRFMGKFTPFDIILGFIIGSLLSRSIDGKAPLFETVCVVFLMVALHIALSYFTIKFPAFGRIVNGEPRELVSDGRILWNELEKSRISEDDVMEALRTKGKTDQLDHIRKAFLERNGEISILKRE